MIAILATKKIHKNDQKKNTALNPPKPWHPLEQQYFKSMDDRHFGYITKLTQK
jgi:hypothetical protein